MQQKKFPDGIKKKCETLEPVRWIRGGLRWKVILVPFLNAYNKCAFLLKRPFAFWLTLVHNRTGTNRKFLVGRYHFVGVPRKVENFFSNWATTCYSRRTELRAGRSGF
jgi:hypothetical protein